MLVLEKTQKGKNIESSYNRQLISLKKDGLNNQNLPLVSGSDH